MRHTARVNVYSDDLPHWVDGKAEGALVRTSARARNVKRGDRAVGSPQEAVTHIALVSVVSHDRRREVEVRGDCALVLTCPPRP